jgi:hypothetical protein
MQGFDWLTLARGALWVSGLSLALAAWSYASWWASVHRLPLRQALGRNAFVAPFDLGLALFAAAMAWGAVATWERAAWGAVSLILVILPVRSLLR